MYVHIRLYGVVYNHMDIFWNGRVCVSVQQWILRYIPPYFHHVSISPLVTDSKFWEPQTCVQGVDH